MELRLYKPNEQDVYNFYKNINDVLCEDILLTIFHNLSLREIYPLRRVCRYWNNLINEQILKTRKELIICLILYSTNKYFKRKDIAECYYVRTHLQLSPIAIYHQNLKVLKVFNFMIGHWFQSDILTYVNKLKSISFTECTFSSPTTSLFKSLENITRLELINMGIDDDIVKQISQNLKQLQHLNLSQNSMITGRYMDCLANSLKNLSLTFCSSLNLHHLYNSLKSLAEKGTKLEVLNLKYVPNNNKSLTQRICFLDYLKHLREIKLSTSYILRANIEYSFRHIEKIVLYENYNITDETLVSDSFFSSLFNEEFSNLKQLHLTSKSAKICDNEFARCLNACPNLESLKMINLFTLTNRSLKLISNLKSLSFLKLDNINLDNNTVMEIIENCHNLKTLIIDFNESKNGFTTPFSFNEHFIFRCMNFFHSNPNRKLELKMFRTLLPTHKILTTIPKNLKLNILQSKYILRSKPLFDEEMGHM